MSEPTESIETDIVCTFVERLRAQLGDAVQVEIAWPGQELELDAIWFGPTEFTATVPTSKTGRRHQQEDFTLHILIQAAERGMTQEESMRRAAEMYAALSEIIATDSTFDSMPGLQDIGFESTRTRSTHRTSTGAVTYMACEIAVTTRYQ